MGKNRNEIPTYGREIGLDQKIAYDASNNAIYVGKTMDMGALTSEAKWQIYKMNYDANNNMDELRWADGNDNFDKVWDNRATYSYAGI